MRLRFLQSIFGVILGIIFFYNRVFRLVGLFIDFVHGLQVFLLKVFADLFNDVVEGSILILCFLFLLLVHLLYELNKRVLYFSRSIGKNHHYKIPHQVLPIVEALGSFIVNQPWIMKFAKASEVHWHLIIQTH